jgi:competence protein ComEC
MKRLDFRKYPAVFTFLPLSLGILLSYYLDISISSFPAIYFALFLTLLTLASILIYNKTKLVFSRQYLFFLLPVFIFGVISMQYYYHKVDDNSIQRSAGKFKYSNVIIYGTITDEPDVNDDRMRMIVEVDSLSQGINTFQFKGSVLVSVYRNKFTQDEPGDYQIGNIIQVNARLEPLPHTKNPGEFDYGGYLKMHGIEAIASAVGFAQIKKTGDSPYGFYKTKIISPVKAYINSVINNNSGGDQREFLRGLLLGDKSNISKETKQDFVNAGVAHIIAVSGLNVAYVLIVLSGIFLLVPLPRGYKNLLIIICLLFYMNLTGNSPSIVRATIMAIVFLLAQFFERRPNSYNVIAFAALIIIIIDPRQLFDSGFILSFAAILSIVIFTPQLANIMQKFSWYSKLNNDSRLNKYIRAAVLLFAGTLAAQLGTLPLTAIMFKKISVVSLIVNLFAIPVSHISLALGFVTVFVSLISGWAASVFAYANNFIMYYLLKAITISARLDFSYVETYRMDFLLFIAFYVIVFLLFTINRINYKARIIMIILLVINFFVFETIFSQNTNTKIAYIDVGNSNCALLSLPEGTNILINAGTSSQKYSSAERNLLPYFKREGISKIDLLIITAIDANEIRNLRYLVNNFNIKKILMPEYYRPVFDNDIISDAFKKTTIDFVDSSRVINSKGKFRIYLYYDKQLAGASMLANFVYGSESFVFDDAEEQSDISANNNFLEDNTRLTSLRVPQFGSFDFTPADFILKTAPACIVISSQKNRSKITETDVFEETLEKMGFKVFSVANRGAVIMETDGVRTKLIDWN